MRPGFHQPLLLTLPTAPSWGGNGALLTRLRRSKIQLPVNEASEPDFEYMENYIKEIEAAKYKKYLDYID